MKKRTAILAVAIALIAFPGASRAQDAVSGVTSVATQTLTLNDCIALAMSNNPELLQRAAEFMTVEGEKKIVDSRFGNHVDTTIEVNHGRGSMQKTYYPDLTPTGVSSLGSVNVSSTSLNSLSSGAGLGGLSPDAISSALGGADVCQYAGMASQFGVDLSSYCGKGRMAGQAIGGIDVNQLNQAIAGMQALLTQLNAFNQVSSVPPRAASTNDWAIRYSRRLLEFGKTPSAVNTLRANQQTALYNYQQKLRDVLSNVRTSFFVTLLKQQQISEREKLLVEYQAKYDRLNKRFEIAQDVPRIDVLTAELDVLNERLSINQLQTDLMKKKMDLMQSIGRPLTVRVEFDGRIEPFDVPLDEVIGAVKQNSYQVNYLKFQLGEQDRVIRELAWDKRPIFDASLALEDKRTTMGFALNNSNQSYGVDFGMKTYANLSPSSKSSSSSSLTSLLLGGGGSGSGSHKNNYSAMFAVSYILTDGTKTRGVKERELAKMKNLRAQLAQEETTEELNVRKAYADWLAAVEQERIQADTVAVSKRRLEITRKLREYNKVQEFQVDNFRSQYFNDVDRLFREQENVITAQENLRKIMGRF